MILPCRPRPGTTGLAPADEQVAALPVQIEKALTEEPPELADGLL